MATNPDLAQMKDKVRLHMEQKGEEYSDAFWTEFVQEISLYLHENPMWFVATANLMKNAVLTEKDFSRIVGESPTEDEFCQKLQPIEVPYALRVLLYKKYFAREDDLTQPPPKRRRLADQSAHPMAADKDDEGETTTERMRDLFDPMISNTRPRDFVAKRLSDMEKTGRAPFLAIVQSSGYGKTRAASDLGKLRHVVYLLCKDIPSGLESPAVVKKFIASITSATSDNVREGRAEKFFQAVVETVGDKGVLELFDGQFRDGGFNTGDGNFYDALDKNWKRIKKPTKSPKVKRVAATPTTPTEDLASVKSVHFAPVKGIATPSRDFSPEEAEQGKWKGPGRLVIIFDEALGLTGDTRGEAESSSYRCIRRVLGPHRLFGVFLDTSAKLGAFLADTDHPKSTSDRGISYTGRITEPLFEINTFDEFVDNDFFRGRPLWRMQWLYRLKMNYDSLIHHAKDKLTSYLWRDGEFTKACLCSLFLCRFGMQARMHLAEELVASHMATLLSVSADRKTVTVGYKSEPILAEASAFLTTFSGVVTVAEVVAAVKASMDSNLIARDEGDRGGEVVAGAAWLGYLLDDVRREGGDYDAVTSNLSRPVPVRRLVEKLVPGQEMTDEVRKILRGWEINLTHFTRLSFKPAVKILEKCWNQHAGLYLPAGEEGIDLLLAMKNEKSDSLASIRVRIKNHRNDIGDQTTRGILEKLRTRRCAPICDESFSVGLLLQVGRGRQHTVCRMMSDKKGMATTRTVDKGMATRTVDKGMATRSSDEGCCTQLQIACNAYGDHVSWIRKLAGSETCESSTIFQDGPFAQELCEDCVHGHDAKVVSTAQATDRVHMDTTQM